MKRGSQGFTLIEILLATTLLAFGLLAIWAGLTNCATMMILSKKYQDVQYVFALGELKYPMLESTDVESDVPVDPDHELVEGYIFERTVDEKELRTNEVDDGLYIVRTVVSWGRSENEREELVRYVRQLGSESEKRK